MARLAGTRHSAGAAGRATTEGFAPGAATLNARFGDDDWQQVDMAARNDGFEFTFFSVREPLEYFVSAAGVRSETFRIVVVDLPEIDRLTNTYTYPEWTGRDLETRDPGGDA